MIRDQFTFYRSFWEAMKVLPKKDQLLFVTAICSFVFEDEDLPLSGAAAASFLLVKPVLDMAAKRAASGRCGGSKPKANGKQTQANGKQTASESEGEKEGEKEKEGEVDVDVEGETPPFHNNNAFARVLRAYHEQINPESSQDCRDTLRSFTEELGAEVCLRAFDVALDAKKASWPYIKKVLEDKQSKGVRSLADWDRLERERKMAKGSGDESWLVLAERLGGGQ